MKFGGVLQISDEPLCPPNFLVSDSRRIIRGKPRGLMIPSSFGIQLVQRSTPHRKCSTPEMIKKWSSSFTSGPEKLRESQRQTWQVTTGTGWWWNSSGLCHESHEEFIRKNGGWMGCKANSSPSSPSSPRGLDLIPNAWWLGWWPGWKTLWYTNKLWITSPFCIGKSTISIRAIFNSQLLT